jgi:hypothetical protein
MLKPVLNMFSNSHLLFCIGEIKIFCIHWENERKKRKKMDFKENALFPKRLDFKQRFFSLSTTIVLDHLMKTERDIRQ